MKKIDPNDNAISGKPNTQSRISLKNNFSFTAIKEWFLDLIRVFFKPRVKTFQEASTHAENKLIISIFILILINAMEFLVCWYFIGTGYFTFYHIIAVVFWQPITAIIIIIVLYTLIRKGFLSLVPSFKSLIYSSSLILTIEKILLISTFIILMPIVQSINSYNIVVDVAYIFSLLLDFIYSIVLCIICARALLPNELYGKFVLIVYWAFIIYFAFKVSQYICIYILSKIDYPTWYWGSMIPLIAYGICLGIFQFIILYNKYDFAQEWLIVTIVGSIIGAILYCVILKFSCSDIYLDLQTQAINIFSRLLLYTTNDQVMRIIHITNTILNILLYGGIILPIGIVQWLVLREKVQYSYLWVLTILVCKELELLHSGDTFFLFIQWVLPGIILAFLLSRPRQSMKNNRKYNVSTLPI